MRRPRPSTRRLCIHPCVHPSTVTVQSPAVGVKGSDPWSQQGLEACLSIPALPEHISAKQVLCHNGPSSRGQICKANTRQRACSHSAGTGGGAPLSSSSCRWLSALPDCGHSPPVPVTVLTRPPPLSLPEQLVLHLVPAWLLQGDLRILAYTSKVSFSKRGHSHTFGDMDTSFLGVTVQPAACLSSLSMRVRPEMPLPDASWGESMGSFLSAHARLLLPQRWPPSLTEHPPVLVRGVRLILLPLTRWVPCLF